MSIRLDFKDEQVQILIRIFCPKYHCLKIYNIANELYTTYFDGDYEMFRDFVRKIVLVNNKKELSLSDAFSIGR